jgi:tryptophan halogenase
LRVHFPTRDFAEPLADSYNDAMASLYEHIRDFVVVHYCTTQREDTEYWRANKHNPNVPPRLAAQLERWRYRAPAIFDNKSGFKFFHPTSFHYIHAGMHRFTEPTDYVRNRLPSERVAFVRRRIRDVHANALAASIDHVEYLKALHRRPGA